MAVELIPSLFSYPLRSDVQIPEHQCRVADRHDERMVVDPPGMFRVCEHSNNRNDEQPDDARHGSVVLRHSFTSVAVVTSKWTSLPGNSFLMASFDSPRLVI